MSRKTATIIIIFFILILVGFVVWFYFTKIKPSGEPLTPNGFDDGFIFPDSPASSGGKVVDNTTTGGEITTNVFRPRIIQLTNTPTSSGVLIKNDDVLLGRYIERATGHIYDILLSNLSKTRVSNTTIPKIYEVYWRESGEDGVVRYLDSDEESILTFSGELQKSTDEQGDGSFPGVFLPKNIKNLSLAPSGKKLFYLLWTEDGSTGVSSNLDGTSKVQLWSAPLREWLVDWTSPTNISMTSKPSFDTQGSLFFLNTSTAYQTKVLGGIYGLTAKTNPDASKIVYSQTKGSGFESFIYDVATKKSQAMTVDTLPEKCVWSTKTVYEIYCAIPTQIKGGYYPDDWYKGTVSFSDDIWKINTKNGLTEFIIGTNSATGEGIDSINLSLGPDEKFLLLTNKNDLTLWAVQMKE